MELNTLLAILAICLLAALAIWKQFNIIGKGG